MANTSYVAATLLILFMGSSTPVSVPTVGLVPSEPPQVVVPRVTISGVMTLEEVADEISRQAGIQLSVIGRPRRTYAPQFHETPVLQAIAGAIRASGANIGFSGADGSLLLVAYPGSRQTGTYTYCDPCLFSPQPMRRGPDGRAWLAMTCYVVTDPPPVQVLGPRETELTDQMGRDLLVRPGWSPDSQYQRRRNFEQAGGISRAMVLSHWVTLPPDTTSIQRFRGAVRLVFATKTAQTTFNLEGDVGEEWKVGGLTVKYRGLEKNTRLRGEDEREAYTLAVSGDPNAVCGLQFRDSSGARVGWSHYDRDTVSAPAVFSLVPRQPATTLACRVIVESFEREYPFEIKDIPVLSE